MYTCKHAPINIFTVQQLSLSPYQFADANYCQSGSDEDMHTKFRKDVDDDGKVAYSFTTKNKKKENMNQTRVYFVPLNPNSNRRIGWMEAEDPQYVFIPGDHLSEQELEVICAKQKGQDDNEEQSHCCCACM